MSDRPVTALEVAMRQYVVAALAFGQVVSDLLREGGPDHLNAVGATLPPELLQELAELDEAVRWGREQPVETIVAVLHPHGVT